MPMPKTMMFKAKHSTFKDIDSDCGGYRSYFYQDLTTEKTTTTSTGPSSLASSLSHFHQMHQQQPQQQQAHVKHVHFWDMAAEVSTATVANVVVSSF